MVGRCLVHEGEWAWLEHRFEGPDFMVQKPICLSAMPYVG